MEKTSKALVKGVPSGDTLILSGKIPKNSSLAIPEEHTIILTGINSPKVGNKAIDSIYGVLEIPKIKLKQAYYEKKSKKNTVEKHLELLEDKNNLLVLAAHSGNSYVGYFKNLDKLSLDDCVYLYRKDKKERYVVSDIYELDKKGTITINHNEKEKVLVLTTCSKQKDKQLIVVCKYLKNT